MELEFIYWRHLTPAGIRVEEVTGKEDKSGRVWVEMAKQIYGENGKDAYRAISHFPNGAPFVEGTRERISVTHAGHMLAVASLPATPETDLAEFSPRAAMGIDAESSDRAQVLKIRDKFLSEREQAMIAADDVRSNIIAWTAKEAMYKAAMTDSLDDYRGALEITHLPDATPEGGEKGFGKGMLHLGERGDFEMDLYSYESDGYILTLAYSTKCAKFKGREVKL